MVETVKQTNELNKMGAYILWSVIMGRKCKSVVSSVVCCHLQHMPVYAKMGVAALGLCARCDAV